MTKDRSRKAPKRKPPKVQLDDDMTELAVALAQYEIDEGAAGWLKMPWRSGWNAVRFAIDFAHVQQLYPEDEFIWLNSLIPLGGAERWAYWTIQDFLEKSSGRWPMFHAAMRCAQIMLTDHGSGDGSIFNAVLTRPLVEWRAPADLTHYAQCMESARCRDSIGVGALNLNDGNDWLRSAFRIAWRRRLYGAAYALPPARKLS